MRRILDVRTQKDIDTYASIQSEQNTTIMSLTFKYWQGGPIQLTNLKVHDCHMSNMVIDSPLRINFCQFKGNFVSENTEFLHDFTFSFCTVSKVMDQKNSKFRGAVNQDSCHFFGAVNQTGGQYTSLQQNACVFNSFLRQDDTFFSGGLTQCKSEFNAVVKQNGIRIMKDFNQSHSRFHSALLQRGAFVKGEYIKEGTLFTRKPKTDGAVFMQEI